MSDNTFDSHPVPSNALSPPEDTGIGSAVPDDDPYVGDGRDRYTEQVHQLHTRKFTLPEYLRQGAIAHRYGPDDIDAIHAAKLKSVQNSAFLRAVWMANAVDNDLDTDDPKHQWGLFVNGVLDDLAHARADAEHAGLDRADIDHAEQLGSAGTIWERRPAHQRLGRLEQLSYELDDAETRLEAQQRQIDQLTGLLATAHAAAENLAEDLAHAQHTTLELLGEIVDRGWEASRHQRNPASISRWARMLREANATLAAATLVDGLSPTEADSVGQSAPPGAGMQISDAIDAAMIDPDNGGGPDSVLSPEQPELGADRGPEVEP